jgi:hypothetical protein
MDHSIGASRGPQESAHRPDAPLVLFALRPRFYSEAIGRVVAELRPRLEVLVVEPEDLPAEMGRRTPALVLCSHPRPDGRDADAVRWAEYRPYEDPEVVRVDGHDVLLPGLCLEDLIGLVDRLAARLPSGRLSVLR